MNNRHISKVMVSQALVHFLFINSIAKDISGLSFVETDTVPDP